MLLCDRTFYAPDESKLCVDKLVRQCCAVLGHQHNIILRQTIAAIESRSPFAIAFAEIDSNTVGTPQLPLAAADSGYRLQHSCSFQQECVLKRRLS
jgi:hypothetical protein